MSLDESLIDYLPEACDWCPRRCGANRKAGQTGFCGADGTLRAARAALHYWEEPPLSGTSGSGAIFFSGCPLRCCFCQNASIAVGDFGKQISLERLERLFFELKEQGALNINVVTPTHYALLIARAARAARQDGFDLPFVWNTSGYELVRMVDEIADVADVFLDDFKYASPELARAYSHARDYPQVAIEALDAMIKHTGAPQFDEYHGQTRLVRGVIVRHLLLPGQGEDSKAVIKLLHERYGKNIMLSIMNQYTPVLDPQSKAAAAFPRLLSVPTDEEYEDVLDYADSLGVEDYFWQEGAAISESFIPSFDGTGL